MLSKSRIFYFLITFIITIFVGFFVWDAGLSFGNNLLNQIANYASKINAEIFTASISQSQQAEQNLEPEPDLAPEETLAEDVVAPTVESVQDQLDDIQEKLDIISARVQELIAEQDKDGQVTQTDKDKQDENQDANNKTAETIACNGQININTAAEESLDEITGVGPATAQKIILARPFYSLNDLLKVSGIGPITLQKIIDQGCAFVEPGLVPPVLGGGGGGGGGGPSPTVYPKILISEVKIAEKNGDKNVFIELYNPNNQDVDLTNWYIFRNDTSFITKPMLSGKKIFANSYFLLTKEGSIWDNQSDLLFDSTLNDNDKISLKNPGGDPADDEASWSQIASSLSLGRKWDSATNSYGDFELDTPTPKLQNTPYIAKTLASIAITTPATKLTYNIGDSLDITGLVVTGTYSDNSTQIETITAEDIIGFDKTTVGVQTLTITFGGQTATFDVTVVAPPLSTDATVTSVVYTVSPIESGAGAITGVIFGTTKANFLNNLVFAPGALENATSSSLSDPIVSNDTLAVTAQDGITTANYMITTDAPANVATQLKIKNLPPTLNVDTASSVITVESQNASGVLTKVSQTTDVDLFSSSVTGVFSSKSSTTCGTDWTIKSIKISSGDAHRSFCYKDSDPGTPTIIVSAAGLSSDSQIVTVNAVIP